MKLIEFSRYEYLNLLRRQMGADKLGSFAPVGSAQKLTPIELDQLISSGIDVTLDDIRILDDGTLGYKDSRVLVYSRDVSLASDVDDVIWQMPRFHFANCTEFQEAVQRNRWARYVVAIKEDGNFAINKVHKFGGTKRDALRLITCEQCLNALAFDGFSFDLPDGKRRKIVNSFSIGKFFTRYPKCLVVDDSVQESDPTPNEGYVHDFSEFSARMKRERGYQCDHCKIVLVASSVRKFLHVTYNDEAKRKPDPKNVKVLCLRCHADQPKHEPMKSLLEYREFIRRFGQASGPRI